VHYVNPGNISHEGKALGKSLLYFLRIFHALLIPLILYPFYCSILSTGKKKFGRKNNKSLIPLQDASTASQQSPLRQAADPLKDLSPQQLLRKARDLMKLKDSQMENITQLKAENNTIKEQSNDKDRKMEYMAREHSKMMQEETLGKDARIRAMKQLHSSEIAKKGEELKALAIKLQVDKKASNIVSVQLVFEFAILRNG